MTLPIDESRGFQLVHAHLSTPDPGATSADTCPHKFCPDVLSKGVIPRRLYDMLWEEIALLDHIPDIPTQPHGIFFRDIAVVDQNCTACVRRQSVDYFHGRCFAAAARTDENDERASLNLKIHSFDRVKAIRVFFFDIFKKDYRYSKPRGLKITVISRIKLNGLRTTFFAL